MSNNGRFVWRELMTNDLERALNFYTGVFGWTTAPWGDTYTLLRAGERGVAGAMKWPEPGMPDLWQGYVQVPDARAQGATIEAQGGKVVWGPNDMPEVGVLASAVDNQGAAIAYMTPHTEDGPAPNPPPVGDFCWSELNAADQAAAEAFYAAAFGWTWKPDPMGDMKDYKSAFVGDFALGGLAQAPAGAPSAWLFYVVVADLAAANAKAVSLGGRLLVERVDLPFGSMSVLADPSGTPIGAFEFAKQG